MARPKSAALRFVNSSGRGVGLDRLRGGGHAFPWVGAAIETQLANTTKIQRYAIHAFEADRYAGTQDATAGGAGRGGDYLPKTYPDGFLG